MTGYRWAGKVCDILDDWGVTYKLDRYNRPFCLRSEFASTAGDVVNSGGFNLDALDEERPSKVR